MKDNVLVGPFPKPIGLSSLEMLVRAAWTKVMTLIGPSPEPADVRATTESS